MIRVRSTIETISAKDINDRGLAWAKKVPQVILASIIATAKKIT